MSEEIEIITLENLTYCYLLMVLESNNGSRTKAAESLGISLRTVRTYIKKMKGMGFIVPDPQGWASNDPLPTNEERIKHLDYMANSKKICSIATKELAALLKRSLLLA